MPRDDRIDGEALDVAPLPVAVFARPAPLAALEGRVGVRDDCAARRRDDQKPVLAAHVAVVGQASHGGAREPAHRPLAAAGLHEPAPGQPHPHVLDHLPGAGVREDRLGDFRRTLQQRQESGRLPLGGLEVEADVARIRPVRDDAVRAGHAHLVHEQFLRDLPQPRRGGLRVGPYRLRLQPRQPVTEEHRLAHKTAVNRLADRVLDIREGDVNQPVRVPLRQPVVEPPRKHKGGQKRRPHGPREPPCKLAVDLHRGTSTPLRSRMTALTAPSRSGRPLRTAMP